MFVFSLRRQPSSFGLISGYSNAQRLLRTYCVLPEIFWETIDRLKPKESFCYGKKCTLKRSLPSKFSINLACVTLESGLHLASLSDQTSQASTGCVLRRSKNSNTLKMRMIYLPMLGGRKEHPNSVRETGQVQEGGG